MSTDITKLIYSNTDSDEITELQSLLYNDELSFDDYLLKALGKLNSLLIDYFGNQYCFGKLYYLGSLVPFDFHKIDFYNNPKNRENQIFLNGIRTAESLVDERKAESLSVVLIKGKLRGIVLHKGTENPISIPGITRYNYSEDSYTVFNKLESHIVDKIQPILCIHKEMAEKCMGEVYSYLL